MTVTLRKWENITCNYIHYILSTFHCCLLQSTSYAHISNKLLETNPRIFSVTSSTRSRSQKLSYSCIKTLSPHFLWFSNLILTSISKSLCILMFGRNKDSQNPPTRESTVFSTTHLMLQHTHWQITVHCLDSLIRAWNGKSLNLLTFCLLSL